MRIWRGGAHAIAGRIARRRLKSAVAIADKNAHLVVAAVAYHEIKIAVAVKIDCLVGTRKVAVRDRVNRKIRIPT